MLRPYLQVKFGIQSNNEDTVFTIVIFRKFPQCKYVGIYIMDRPAILVRDPEIVEDVLVKNFSHFRDNDLDVKIEHDEIFGDNPIVLKGEAWKRKRTQHLLSFTPAKVSKY